jgi:hypothetical protein
MSVRDRFDDAIALWNLGRKEAAWVMALVATAATARKRYPKPTGDAESFKRFIRDVSPTVLLGNPSWNPPAPISIVLEDTPLEDIMYEHLRCFLIHEAVVSPKLYFTGPVIKDGRTAYPLKIPVRSQGEVLFGIPENFVANLLKAVEEAPENRDLFADAPVILRPGDPGYEEAKG